MKIKIDTTDAKERQEFLEAVTTLVTQMKFRGKAKNHRSVLKSSVQQLTLEQLLRIEVMMGAVEKVAMLLELGADPDHKTKKVSARDLAQAYKRNDILEVMESFAPTPKAVKRAKPKPSY